MIVPTGKSPESASNEGRPTHRAHPRTEPSYHTDQPITDGKDAGETEIEPSVTGDFATPVVGLRLYSFDFILAIIGQTLFVFANAVLLTQLGRWIKTLGGDERDIGVITSFGTAAGLFCRPLLSRWIDRLGAKTSWAIGLTLFVPVIMGFALLPSVGPAIYGLRLLSFLGAALVFSGSLSYVSQTTPVGRRTEAIGILGAGGFAGIILGPVVADWILGAQQDRARFFLLFSVGAVSCILSLLLCAFQTPAPSDRFRRAAEPFSKTVRAYWPGRILWVCLVFGVCMMIPFGFISRYIDEIGVGDVGRFFLVYAGWGLFVRVAFRRFPQMFGDEPVLRFGMVAMALGMFSYLLVTPEQKWLLYVPAVLTGTGHALCFHTMMSLATGTFPLKSQGAGAIFVLMSQDIGAVVGSPIMGFVAYHLGYRALFALVGVVCLFALPACKGRPSHRELALPSDVL